MVKIGIRFYLIIFSGLTFLLVSGQSFAAASLRPQKQDTAIGFSLSDLQGKSVSLSDFKGRPVILFFWASWCPYCRAELSTLMVEYPNMKASQIKLLAINVHEPRYKVENFLEGKNLEFTVLLDTDARVSEDYNVVGIPTFVLIDADGVTKFNGNILPDDYNKLLKSE